MTDMPSKMYQLTKIVPGPEDDNGEELIENNGEVLRKNSMPQKPAGGRLNKPRGGVKEKRTPS